MILGGDTLDVRDFHGEPIKDDTFLLLFNASHQPVKFILAGRQDVSWEMLIDTRLESGFLSTPLECASGDELELEARSIVVLRLSHGSQEHARTASWKQSLRATPALPPQPPPPSIHQEVDPSTP
jgi:glycogen operon protein